MPNIRGIGKLDDSEFAVYRLMRDMGIRPASKDEIHQLTSRLETLEYETVRHELNPGFVDSVREVRANLGFLPANPVSAYRQYMVRYARDGSLAMKYFYLLNAYHDFAKQLESGDPEIASKLRRIVEYLEGRSLRDVHATGLLILLNLLRHGDEFYSSVGKMLLSGMTFFNICKRPPSTNPTVIYGFNEYLLREILWPTLWKENWLDGAMAQMTEFPPSELSAARLHFATPEKWDRYMRLGRINDGLPYWVMYWQVEKVFSEAEAARSLAFLPQHELSPLMIQAMLNTHNLIPLKFRELRIRNDARWEPFLALQQAKLRVIELEEGAPESYSGELQQLREGLSRNAGNSDPHGSSSPASRVSRSRHAQDARTHAPSHSRRPMATRAGMRRSATSGRVRA